MAIFHLNESNISRSDGRSAVACAAYRACEKLEDSTYGITQDYTRKKGLEYKNIYAPDHTNEKLLDRQTLWNEVEKKEFNANGSMKENARLAKEYTCALPHELTDKERIKIVDDFCRDFVKKHNVIVDACIHAPHENKGKDNKNYHVHIMFTTRLVNDNGDFGKKQRTFNDNGPEILKDSRATFANVVNAALENAGFETRVDHRSNKDRGLDQEATVHEGSKVTQLRRMNIDTEISLKNDAINKRNSEKILNEQSIKGLDQEIILTKVTIEKYQKELVTEISKNKSLALEQAAIRAKEFHQLYADFVNNFDDTQTLQQQFEYITDTNAYNLAKQYISDFELLEQHNIEPKHKPLTFWKKLKGQTEQPFFDKTDIEKEINDKFFKIFFEEYKNEQLKNMKEIERKNRVAEEQIKANRKIEKEQDLNRIISKKARELDARYNFPEIKIYGNKECDYFFLLSVAKSIINNEKFEDESILTQYLNDKFGNNLENLEAKSEFFLDEVRDQFELTKAVLCEYATHELIEVVEKSHKSFNEKVSEIESNKQYRQREQQRNQKNEFVHQNKQSNQNDFDM